MSLTEASGVIPPFSSEQLPILVIDDDKPMAYLLGRLLEESNYKITIAFDMQQAKSMLEKQFFPVIISDINLGSDNGLSLISFKSQTALNQKSVIIFITGQASVDTAVTAIRGGAFEYLPKPADLSDLEKKLKSSVERAMRHLQMLAEDQPIEKFRGEDKSGKPLIGSSPKMAAIYRSIAEAALYRGNVLILGDTGTGKELVARAIHEYSAWANEPFVSVNCGALTETLLESELFGHVKGSFTGAVCNKKGLFEEADKGTLFLDEIGDISVGMQVKLLRTLQNGEIKPVGACDTMKVNVRIIAATNRNLAEMVGKGEFREDLYYRLKVFVIDVPPLRERADDLPQLIEHFVAKSAKKFNKIIHAVSHSALEMLYRNRWPGNVRELENAVERAVLVAKTTTLFPEDFPEEIQHRVFSRETTTQLDTVTDPKSVSLSDTSTVTLRDLEKSHIVLTLKQVNFNKSKAARLLGIDRVTLYRKALQYGINLNDLHQNSEA